MRLISSLLIIASLCITSVAMATDYFVNPAGNDVWSGSLKVANAKKTDGPFKTIERAKQAIRALKQTNTFIDKVSITIAAGNYVLNQPLNFNVMDSGLPGRDIVWQGEKGAKVTISAGLPITCKKRDAIFWDCPLTKLPVNTAYFDTGRIKGNTPKFELFVNEQKLELARWPDKDWAHIKLPLDEKTQFTVMETLPTLTGDIKAAQIHIFAGNDWFDQYVGVDAINQTANALTLSASTSSPLQSGRRFYLQNLPVLLNAPGEWIYDVAAKKVSFISPSGISPNQMVLSSLPNIIIADGVNYLTFKNINLQYSTGTALVIKNANNVVLDQLNINNIGGKGVEIKSGQNVWVSNSKIHHTGAHGIVVSGGDRNTLKASGHVIHNNHIHHMGTTILTYSSGIETNGVGNTITHNLLEQGAGTAMLITGNDHLIEKNEVHHFCLQASDCGAIYSGRDWSWRGNAIRYNYIHDVIGFSMRSVDLATNQTVYSTGGAVGVYLDDAVSGFEINSNIFENAGSMSIQIGGGRDNKVINNYFNTSEYAIWVDDRWPAYNWENMQKTLDASPYKSPVWLTKYPELATAMHNKKWPEGNKIERNIIVAAKPSGLLFRYFLPIDSTVIADNIVWSPSGNPTVDYKVLELNKNKGGAAWNDWVSQKIEQGSLIVDPCVTISNKKMTTCASSPVKDIGFKPLPTDIGLIP